MAQVSGSASADIDAPIDAVWAIVQDVERWPEWQGTLGALRALDHDSEQRATVCHMELDAKVTQIKMKLRCEYEPPARMSFQRESGDLSSLAGSWQLKDLGDGRTRATYELVVNPGGVLNFLLNDATTKRLRETLVDVRPRELKVRAESG
jgi:ribosome-associated toxin RatA of RatAB toxin-antitoxin module